MTHRTIPLLMPLAAALALGAHLQPAHARPGHHAAPPPYQGAPAAPHHAAMVSIDGQVQRLLVNPFGEVNGLLLGTGQVVDLPHHLGDSVAAAVSAGATVRLSGHYSPHGSLRVSSLTNLATGAVVTDVPPVPYYYGGGLPRLPRHLAAQALVPLNATGTIVKLVRSGSGTPRVALLDNGTLVYFPPHAAYVAGAQLVEGAVLQASGLGSTTVHGVAIEALRMGAPGQMQPLYQGQ